jgi:hypothetical protein
MTPVVLCEAEAVSETLNTYIGIRTVITVLRMVCLWTVSEPVISGRQTVHCVSLLSLIYFHLYLRLF